LMCIEVYLLLLQISVVNCWSNLVNHLLSEMGLFKLHNCHFHVNLTIQSHLKP